MLFYWWKRPRLWLAYSLIFPHNLKESIGRQQVWVLLDVAMTDYAAQGKARPYNVVHLNSCYSHLSYYTCLSKSASEAGTIIIQGLKPSVITRGCSGYIKQEFRQHKILDDITGLRYEGQLPTNIQGYFINSLIRQYQIWKGTSYVSDHVDNTLKWSLNDPMDMLPVVTDGPWQLPTKNNIKQNTQGPQLPSYQLQELSLHWKRGVQVKVTIVHPLEKRN